MALALGLFLATYVLLMVFGKYRVYIALGSALLFVVLGILPLGKVIGAIDWNVIMMLAGTMGAVSLFIESKMPSLLADLIIERMPNVKWTVIALSLFAGIISAFVDNVATVLMVAPVALTISRKLKISPVNAIIAIAISSNLQGAATLVGDTTSILLGGYAGMNFGDFFVFHGRPGMFWVVQVGAVVSTFVLMWLFRKDSQPVKITDRTQVTDYFPSAIMILIVALLILASFLPNMPGTINGMICMGLFVIGLVRNLIIKKGDLQALIAPLKDIDWPTLLLLSGLFVVIAGITEAGVVERISEVFVSIGGSNPLVIYSLILWASVLLSAFIDNIPYVATMLPVTAGIASIMNIDPTLLYLGLLAGATLGGNLTPIGASANIAGLGILRKEGCEVSVRKFMSISVPFTLAAVTSAYLLLMWIWWPR